MTVLRMGTCSYLPLIRVASQNEFCMSREAYARKSIARTEQGTEMPVRSWATGREFAGSSVLTMKSTIRLPTASLSAITRVDLSVDDYFDPSYARR